MTAEVKHRNLADKARAAVLSPECSYNVFERAAALVLIQHADWTTGEGRAGQARLAASSGMCVRKLRNVLADIEGSEIGPLVLERTPRLGRPDLYRYRLRNEPRQDVPDTPAGPAAPSGTSDRSPRHVVPTISSGVTPSDNPDTALEANEIRSSGDRPSASPEKLNGARGMIQLPVDWAPNGTHRSKAKAAGLNLDEETKKFRAYHSVKGTQHGNWNAYFGGWLRNQTPGPVKAVASIHKQQAPDDDYLTPTTEEEIADWRVGRGRWAEPTTEEEIADCRARRGKWAKPDPLIPTTPEEKADFLAGRGRWG